MFVCCLFLLLDPVLGHLMCTFADFVWTDMWTLRAELRSTNVLVVLLVIWKSSVSFTSRLSHFLRIGVRDGRGVGILYERRPLAIWGTLFSKSSVEEMLLFLSSTLACFDLILRKRKIRFSATLVWICQSVMHLFDFAMTIFSAVILPSHIFAMSASFWSMFNDPFLHFCMSGLKCVWFVCFVTAAVSTLNHFAWRRQIVAVVWKTVFAEI